MTQGILLAGRVFLNVLYLSDVTMRHSCGTSSFSLCCLPCSVSFSLLSTLSSVFFHYSIFKWEYLLCHFILEMSDSFSTFINPYSYEIGLLLKRDFALNFWTMVKMLRLTNVFCKFALWTITSQFESSNCWSIRAHFFSFAHYHCLLAWRLGNHPFEPITIAPISKM